MIEVEGPDGTVIEFPEGTPPETIKAVMAKQYPKEGMGVDEQGRPGLVGSVTDDRPVDGNSPAYMQIAAGVGDLIEGGLNNSVGLIANPINTVIGRAIGYDGYTADLGQSAREGLGLPEGGPTISAINQGAAGVGAMGGVARGVMGGITSAPVRNALAAFADQPLSGMLAGGGAAGASEATRQAGFGPGVQAGVALAGGVAGYGVGRAANALAQPRVANPVMQAADDLDVTMLPADVGGAGTRLASGVVRRTLGEIPMAEAARNSLRTGANARDRIASNIGRVSDDTGAGQAAQRGAKGFIAKSEKRGDELYENISIPAKAEAQTANTRPALEELTRGFESNPELGAIWTGHPRLKATLDALTPEDPAPRLEALSAARDALQQATQRSNALRSQAGLSGRRMDNIADGEVTQAGRDVVKAQEALDRATSEAAMPIRDGKVSWEDLKRLRTIVGDIAGNPSLASDGNSTKALKAFYGALSKDMEATAGATSPRALTEFKRANQYWRGRENRIETVLSSILGNDMKKGEAAAFEQINRWSQQRGGDFKRLAQAIRSMAPDEANEVRASLLGRMGQASKGRQNADGNQFSPPEFMTQWNGLSARAKTMLFPDSRHREDIGKLVKVMDGMKRSGEYANTSMTSLGTNALATAGTTYLNPFLGAVYAGLQFGGGKLLASPRFARWVSNIPANPSDGAQKHFVQSLGSVAAKDPTIKAEVIQLSDYLKRSVDASPTRVAAATEEEQD